MHPLTTYISGLIKLFFPESCIICTKLGDLFCQSCQSSVKFSINKKQIFLKNKNYSLKPNKNPHIEIYYSTEYQKIKKILHSIKFNHKKELITFWSKSIGLKNILDEVTNNISGPILLTIVPSHKNRISKRGFNMVLDLYSNHLNNIEIRCKSVHFIPDFFLRAKDTRPLFELDKKNRSTELNDAFAITNTNQPNIEKNYALEFKNTTLIIFDDICTTGQTILELKHLAQRLQFKKIIAFTLAFQSLE
jgi:predicted amidophosphoribosyltransferase